MAFEDALSAFLRTPPPPKGVSAKQGTARKKKGTRKKGR
jgi:hypothetical protein